MSPPSKPINTTGIRPCIGVGLLGLILGLSGCSRLETDYGRSVGTEGTKSLNGFGVLREVFRRHGWEDRTVARLSERLNNVDVIVWTPTTERPPDQEVIDWFEEWLQRGEKTLVYVLRDHHTEAAYWRQAAKLAPPEQRMEYRRRVARAELEYQRQLLARPKQIATGWFTAEPLEPPELISRTNGPWAAEVDAFDPLARIEYRVRPSQESDRQSSPQVVGSTTFFPVWEAGMSETEVDVETPLTTAGGTAIVTHVSDETWQDSQILVVSGGSLVNNFGLIQPASQRLALRLIEASEPADAAEPGESPIVGFLYSDASGIVLSSLDPSKMGPSGLEMLTVWPLNLVTIHAAVLGLVVCLMLLPIFGRPRRLAPRSSTDFAVHIDAVAALMARTSEEQYARAKISDYMVRVRGETAGPWVLPPPASLPPPPPPASPPMVAGTPSDGSTAPESLDADSTSHENPTESPPRPPTTGSPNVDANDDQ